MSSATDRVVIGMDPHKRSVTIEVMAADEAVLGGGRFATDPEGYKAMVRSARQWPARVWAIEGCSGIGRHVALRLLRDGEQVVDVPPKLSARAGAGVRHRPGTQDRRNRPALGGPGGHPDGWPAPGGR
jgi:transposase